MAKGVASKVFVDMKHRRNTDDRYRALERAALAGDPDALLRVAQEKARIGEEDEVFLRRATWLHEDLLNIPNYWDPEGKLIAAELQERITLLQSYILKNQDGEIRRTSGYNEQDVLDIIVLESTSHGDSEFAGGEFADYSYELVALEKTEQARVADVWSFNDSSVAEEMEAYHSVPPAPLTRDEIDFIFEHAGAIVTNSSQGFRGVGWFRKPKQLENAWEGCLAEFEEDEAEGEDEA